MKKGKVKSLAKKEEKIIRAFIEENLIEKLKSAIIELGHEPKKVKSEILKASKRISKKLAEKIELKPASKSNNAAETSEPIIEKKVEPVKPLRKTPVKPRAKAPLAELLSAPEDAITKQSVS